MSKLQLAPEQDRARLQSGYTAERAPEGNLVLRMPAVPAVFAASAGGAALIVLATMLITRPAYAPVALIGFVFMACLFAALVAPIAIYQNTHAWILSPGLIKRARSFGGALLPSPGWVAAQTVLLQRELWPDGRGSTDKVFVVADQGSPVRILSAYNWDGHESRLASGGAGSFARFGRSVPTAAAPLAAICDAQLATSASDAVREMLELVARELGAPVEYTCVKARRSPDEVD